MTQKVTAIIQARMTSTRLPGKVLMEVVGRPMLSLQLERMRLASCIEQVILATTVNPADDAVASWGEAEGILVFRGSEADVLSRFHGATALCEAKHFMRVTGDCPLLDPAVCDAVVQEYFRCGADYARTGETFAEGLDCEIISRSALERSHREARLASEREHVTLYVRNYPELFNIALLENDTDDGRYRITVDEERDFSVVREIFEYFYAAGIPHPTMQEIKVFLDTHPDIYRLNASITRNEGLEKSLKEDRLV